MIRGFQRFLEYLRDFQSFSQILRISKSFCVLLFLAKYVQAKMVLVGVAGGSGRAWVGKAALRQGWLVSTPRAKLLPLLCMHCVHALQMHQPNNVTHDLKCGQTLETTQLQHNTNLCYIGCVGRVACHWQYLIKTCFEGSRVWQH